PGTVDLHYTGWCQHYYPDAVTFPWATCVFFYQKCSLYPVQWISTTPGGASTITLMQPPFFCLFMGDLCVFLPKM
ncbi:hypothetical protein ACN22H_004995, partial [Escherichia coli]